MNKIRLKHDLHDHECRIRATYHVISVYAKKFSSHHMQNVLVPQLTATLQHLSCHGSFFFPLNAL